MAETLVELVAKIKVDATNLEKGLSDAERKTETSSKNMAESLKKVGIAMTAIGAIITATMTKAIISFTNTGSELHDLSLKTGVSAKALAGLKYAAEQNGASLGTVEMAIRRTASAMQDAKDGLAETQRGFDRMGLSLTELEGLSPEEQFMKIAGAIANIPDPMARAATAQDLFGRSGMDMLPMLSEGADGLRKMMDEGVRLSGWTEEGANSADALGDAFGTLKTATMGIFNAIGSSLAPTLKDLADKITGLVSKITDWAKAHPELTKTLSLVAIGIGAVLTVIGGLILVIPVITSMIAAFGVVFHVALGPIGLISLAIAGLIAIGIALWQNWDKVSHAFGDIWSNMKNAVLHAVDFILNVLEKFLGWIPGIGDKIRSARDAIANLIDANKIARDAKDAERSLDGITEALTEQEKAVKSAKAALQAAQKEYNDTKNSSAGFGNEIKSLTANEKSLNLKVRDASLELKKQQHVLKDLESAYDNASDTVRQMEQAVSKAEQAISDANRELDKLANPRLEGMQEYEDELANIDLQIKQLQFKKMYAPKGEEDALQQQIDQLEVDREALQLQYDITYDPLIRSAKEAAETAQGLNDEFAPDWVMSRIAELSASLATGGELNQGLVVAQNNLASAQSVLLGITSEYDAQKNVVAEIDTSLNNWNISLDETRNRLEDISGIIENILSQKQELIDTLSTQVAESNTQPTAPITGGAVESTPWTRYIGEDIEGFQHGGLVTHPTLATIGEAGPELITPLSDMNKPILNNIYLDGALIAQIVSKYLDREYRAQIT